MLVLMDALRHHGVKPQIHNLKDYDSAFLHPFVFTVPTHWPVKRLFVSLAFSPVIYCQIHFLSSTIEIKTFFFEIKYKITLNYSHRGLKELQRTKSNVCFLTQSTSQQEKQAWDHLPVMVKPPTNKPMSRPPTMMASLRSSALPLFLVFQAAHIPTRNIRR